MKTWEYYNHAMIPAVTPHEQPNEKELNNPDFWKENKNALFARWTTDFDCGCETNWWYIIKDEKFDIASLKSKRRYEINKGIKNFDVKIINPCDYKEELYSVQVAAFSAYPKKYRPTVIKEEFINFVDTWGKYEVFGAFSRENNELVGYVLLSKERVDFIYFTVLKTKPEYEKYALNAALTEKVMSHYEAFLADGGIICDGARSVNHETHFQDYLEKYFGFRKAYCRLHIKYNPKIERIIKLLYPFRKLLRKFDEIGIAHQINAVLKMEEICRGEEQDR